MKELLNNKLIQNAIQFRYMYFGIIFTILVIWGTRFIKDIYKEIKSVGTPKEKIIKILKNKYFIGIISAIIPIVLEIVLYKNYVIAFSEHTYRRFKYEYSFILLVYIYFWGVKRSEKLNKILDFIVKHRYKIAIVVFLILVGFKINFSSLGVWCVYIGEGESIPIFGESRAIRSDEWLVTTPFILAQEYDGFKLVNENINIGNNDMNIFHAPVLDATVFVRIFQWGYFLFGNEIGFSWSWVLRVIVMFMVYFEFGMMLTKKDKWLSLVFAVWLSFSPPVVWWSILDTLSFAMAVVVLFNAYVSNKNLTIQKKLLIAYGIVVACFYFAGQLYPAWQVPLVYLMIAFILIDFIRYRKNLEKKDYIIMGVTILVTIAVLGFFVISSWTGIKNIMSTKYPGGREEVGGNYDFRGMINYYVNFFTPYSDEFANPCEISAFIYPSLAVLIIGIVAIIKSIKNKNIKDALKNKDNWYIYGVLVVLAIFLAWMIFEWPSILRKITLILFSPPKRTETIFQFACVILTMLVAKKTFDKKDRLIKPVMALIISLLIAVLTYFVAKNSGYAEIFTTYRLSILIPMIFLMNYTLLSSNRKAFGCVMLCISLFAGAYVTPVSVGIAPITDTKIAKAAVNIANEDPQGIWIGGSQRNAQYLIANGIKVLNGVNEYPNYEWINKLDPNHEHEEVWNRYAHIFINLGDETEFKLTSADCYNLCLTYQNLKDMNIKYYYTNEKASEEKKNKFALEELYADDNICQYIYRIN